MTDTATTTATPAVDRAGDATITPYLARHRRRRRDRLVRRRARRRRADPLHRRRRPHRPRRADDRRGPRSCCPTSTRRSASGVVSPTTLGGTPFSMHVEVPDVDAVYERVVADGRGRASAGRRTTRPTAPARSTWSTRSATAG